MQQDLFLQQDEGATKAEDIYAPDFDALSIQISPDAVLFKAALKPVASSLLEEIRTISGANPFRQRKTPGGQLMSAAMTNCGAWGWVTDADGYRYSDIEPETGRTWLPIPAVWIQWVNLFCQRAGLGTFNPDACLINRYAPGAGMGLHQDKDEKDLAIPIVSFSLGAPVLFRWGGLNRQEPVSEFLLEHGDVLVWGGADRMRFHGVKKLRRYQHPLTGHYRYNLTFRQSR